MFPNIPKVLSIFLHKILFLGRSIFEIFNLSRNNRISVKASNISALKRKCFALKKNIGGK
jgi:hypothetical protein